jgi:hypothetical protein
MLVIFVALVAIVANIVDQSHQECDKTIHAGAESFVKACSA